MSNRASYFDKVHRLQEQIKKNPEAISYGL